MFYTKALLWNWLRFTSLCCADDRRKDKFASRSSSVSEAALESAWSSRNYDNPSPISRRSAASNISGKQMLLYIGII